jgi:hypothetical protein
MGGFVGLAHVVWLLCVLTGYVTEAEIE